MPQCIDSSVRSKKTSVRSKKKKKQPEKNSKKKVRRRTERRRQQQRGGKFQRASLMFFSYKRINCRNGLAIYISQSSNNHFKNTTVVHFSAFVDLATEISAILPLWRLKLSVYFHLGEYYWKDFSSPDLGVFLISVKPLTTEIPKIKLHRKFVKLQYKYCLTKTINFSVWLYF